MTKNRQQKKMHQLCGHADQAIRCQVHRPMEHIQGFIGSHWMPPLGEHSPRITRVDGMVIDFGLKNRVVALWKSLSEASVQKAWNGPSTQLIEATSFVERSNVTIKAKRLSYLSGYQTLTTDKNWQSYQPAKKLIKKCGVLAPLSC